MKISFTVPELEQLHALNQDLARCLGQEHPFLEVNVWKENPERMAGIMFELSNFSGKPLNKTYPFPKSGDDYVATMKLEHCDLNAANITAAQELPWFNKFGLDIQRYATAGCDE